MVILIFVLCATVPVEYRCDGSLLAISSITRWGPVKPVHVGFGAVDVGSDSDLDVRLRTDVGRSDCGGFDLGDSGGVTPGRFDFGGSGRVAL